MRWEMPYLSMSFLPTVWSYVRRSKISYSGWVNNRICWLRTVSWTKSRWSKRGYDTITPRDVVGISPNWVQPIDVFLSLLLLKFCFNRSMCFFRFYLLLFCFFRLLTICFLFDSCECVASHPNAFSIFIFKIWIKQHFGCQI